MDILLHVLRDDEGRLTGSAGRRDDTEMHTFSGTFELVARIEGLCAGPVCSQSDSERDFS
jgi:hypothetical protein